MLGDDQLVTASSGSLDAGVWVDFVAELLVEGRAVLDRPEVVFRRGGGGGREHLV